MDNASKAVRCINHEYIVVEEKNQTYGSENNEKKRSAAKEEHKGKKPAWSGKCEGACIQFYCDDSVVCIYAFY